MVTEGAAEAKGSGTSGASEVSGAQDNLEGDSLSLVPCLPESLAAHAAWRLGNLLDVRSTPAFQRGHLTGAVSIPLIPDQADTLEDNLPTMYLPPRHEPLLVVADCTEVARTVVRFLRARGRQAVDGTVATATTLAKWPAGLVRTGASRGHLWRPPDFLVRHRACLPRPGAGPVLDLGAGNGRAAVWLAERGYRVTAVDRHAEALAQAQSLAASRGVNCHILQRDLRDSQQVPSGPWAVVLAFRYLQRTLLESAPSLLQPHGVIMVHTFRWLAGAVDLPAARYCLEAGELLKIFAPDCYDVLVHEEDRDGEGKPVAGIVARLRTRPLHGDHEW